MSESTFSQSNSSKENSKTVASRQPKTARSATQRRLLIAGIVGAVLLLVGVAIGLTYYIHSLSYRSTDDAFIAGDIMPITPRVPGHVLGVYVTDNQWVQEGDLLVGLDPADYDAKAESARAALALAQSKAESANISVGLTEITSAAGLKEATSAVELAKSAVESAGARVGAAHLRLEQAQATWQP
jgi:membrane fusion protein (multidrug efflux system)